jgi:hypothetical protein
MACKEKAYAWDEQISENLAVTIYANHLNPEISADSEPGGATPEHPVTSISVSDTPDSAIAQYFPLPNPPQAGDAAQPGKKTTAPDVKPTTISSPTTSTTRVLSARAVEHILKEAGSRGIHGGLRLENPRFEGGKACVDIHAWAKIEIFGHKVAFDERFSHCVDPARRMTVWNNGWAHIEICFHPPKQIYATLYISKWGFERHWNDCVDLPGPTASLG